MNESRKKERGIFFMRYSKALGVSLLALTMMSFGIKSAMANDRNEELGRDSTEMRWGYHYPRHHGYGYGYGYGSGNYGYGYSPNYYCYYDYAGDYLCYLLSATSNEFSRMTGGDSGHERLSVYERAEGDAVRFLRDGGEPSRELRSAMDSERDLVRRSGVNVTDPLTDQLLAELVLARVSR